MPRKRFHRNLTPDEALAILENVPDAELERRSVVNPAFLKRFTFELFAGAAHADAPRGNIGEIISDNLLTDFGAFEPEKEDA